MGDSGSMLVGFLLAFQAIAVINNYSIAVSTPFVSHHPIIMILAVLSFPILDTIRVFIIRLMLGRSPFTADRNHIHHKFVDNGFDHRTSTFLICILNFAVIAAIYIIGFFNINVYYQLMVLCIIVPLLYLFPFSIKYQNDGRIGFVKSKLIPKLFLQTNLK